MPYLKDRDHENEQDWYYGDFPPPERWSKTFAVILMACWAAIVIAGFYFAGYFAGQVTWLRSVFGEWFR